jgi:NADH:ubiquinone oxidoreductase subunit E
MQGYMPEERISESRSRVNVKLSAYYVIHKNETTARMVLVVCIGVTCQITLAGRMGGKDVHGYWELQFTKKSSEKEGEV